MTTPPTGLRIHAKDGHDFYRRLAAFSYLSRLSRGIGAVVISEGAFSKGTDGSVAADAKYIPFEPGDSVFTAEAEAMLDAYDPAEEFVMIVVDGKGRATCLQMTARQVGSTPKALCEEWARGELGMPWLPGQLVSLDEPAAGLAAGHYVFVWRDGVTLLMRRVELGDDDELEATGDLFQTHVDFTESFRAVGGVNLFEAETG